MNAPSPLLFRIRTYIVGSDYLEYGADYHGGIYTFLRWNNLSASSTSDFGPFWDVTSPVYADFETYVGTLLNHTSNYTGVSFSSPFLPLRASVGR